MRLEILANRLAEKTNTPELEKVVLGQAEVQTLPMKCMPWSGAAQNPPSRDRAYGIIRWQGRTISVHRLIFLLTTKPDYEFRMRCTCEVPLCVNPLHFQVEPTKVEPPLPDQTIIIGGDDEIWTEDEMEELVELILSDYDPKNWDDIVTFPDLIGAPEDLLRKTLHKLNKGYLT